MEAESNKNSNMKKFIIPLLIISLLLMIPMTTTAQSVHQSVKMPARTSPSKSKKNAELKKTDPDQQEKDALAAAEAEKKAQEDAKQVAEIQRKLMTQGKFITQGIYFEPGTDKIISDSSTVLNFIGKVLQDNPKVKVKIIGYPDTTGITSANHRLAKSRAAALKRCFTIDFKIAADRLVTDGKSKLEPVDLKKSPGAKANNRRVDFIKL